MSVFEALQLMIALAMLVLAIKNDNKLFITLTS
ncbi:putative holin-like toxin [Enterococcus hirae]|nr:putative holin-like toxin [Enterococcus hirae]